MINLQAIATIKLQKVSNLLKNRASYIGAKTLHFGNSKRVIKGMPTFLSIEVASICNLNCPECPCGLHQINRENTFMEEDLFNSILKQAAPYIHTMQFFFQGEPLLHPLLVQFIQKANQNNIYTITSTNAQLCDSQKARDIVESGLNQIIISIDGTTQETYERYRIGGSLEKVLQTIDHLNHWKETLKSKFPIIEAQMVIFRHNEHEIEQFKELCKVHNVNIITLKTAQIYNFSSKPELIPQNKKYTRYILKNNQWQLKKKRKNHCYRQWSGAVITSSGDLIPCCFDKLAQHSFGNLNDSTLKELWYGSKAQSFREKILTNSNSIEICRNCSE